MTGGRYLRKGSKVTIRFTPGDYAVTQGMLTYNGQEAIISKTCKMKVRSGNSEKSKKRRLPDSATYGYELEDIVSKFGVPYTFTRDMIE